MDEEANDTGGSVEFATVADNVSEDGNAVVVVVVDSVDDTEIGYEVCRFVVRIWWPEDVCTSCRTPLCN